MKTTEFKYPEVLKECEKAFGSIEPGETYKSANWRKYVSGEISGTRVRMDWELADADEPDLDGKVTDLMIRQFASDIHDIVENGNSDNSSDPLLMRLDGARVRGIDPKGFEILLAELVKNVNSKGHTEYTLYVAFHVEW